MPLLLEALLLLELQAKACLRLHHKIRQSYMFMLQDCNATPST